MNSTDNTDRAAVAGVFPARASDTGETLNADRLRRAADAIDARAEESTQHAPRRLAPHEPPPRYELADCMRAMADAAGDRALTQELFDEVFPALPNVFCAATINYGPCDRKSSYAAAVKLAAAEVRA